MGNRKCKERTGEGKGEKPVRLWHCLGSRCVVVVRLSLFRSCVLRVDQGCVVAGWRPEGESLSREGRDDYGKCGLVGMSGVLVSVGGSVSFCCVDIHGHSSSLSSSLLSSSLLVECASCV